jgi:hypothetical protein
METATTVDAELDRLISRRASSYTRTTADEREELWKASVRRHHEAVRRRNRAAWFAHFCQMAESHARINRDYQHRAEALCEES